MFCENYAGVRRVSMRCALCGMLAGINGSNRGERLFLALHLRAMKNAEDPNETYSDSLNTIIIE